MARRRASPEVAVGVEALETMGFSVPEVGELGFVDSRPWTDPVFLVPSKLRKDPTRGAIPDGPAASKMRYVKCRVNFYKLRRLPFELKRGLLPSCLRFTKSSCFRSDGAKRSTADKFASLRD